MQPLHKETFGPNCYIETYDGNICYIVIGTFTMMARGSMEEAKEKLKRHLKPMYEAYMSITGGRPDDCDPY